MNDICTRSISNPNKLIRSQARSRRLNARSYADIHTVREHKMIIEDTCTSATGWNLSAMVMHEERRSIKESRRSLPMVWENRTERMRPY